MRYSAMVLSGLLVSVAFVSLAPSATAFGWCTFATDPRCPPDAAACIGTRWSYPDPYYTCQYKVPKRCADLQDCVPICLYWNCYPDP